MQKLKFEMETVVLNKLCLEPVNELAVPESLQYKHSDYTLQGIESLTPEAVFMIMQLHPIIAILHKRKFLVVGGKRTFHVAAFVLKPDQEISVVLLDKQTTNEQLFFLKYMDIVVSSLLFRQVLTLAEIYQQINIPKLRIQAWCPPTSTTMKSFSRVLGVSAAALCSTTPKFKLPTNTLQPGDQS